MQKPFFSIVVPTYARPTQLAICLESLAGLDYPRERFEVIVVDDGGETALEGVMASFRGQLHVTLIVQGNAGPAAARNTGASQARGDVLAFIDDDCSLSPDWLNALASRFARTPGHLIGGRTLNALPDNLCATASHLLFAYLYIYYNPEPDQPLFLGGSNLAVSAERFRALGGFNATFPFAAAEDREFSDRWLYHGGQMACAPEAIAYHTHALTVQAFWRQHLNYGRGAFHFHRARVSRWQEQVRVEPPSFYLGMLRYCFSQTQGRRALSLAALLLMSQVANAVGFFWERMKRTGLEKQVAMP